MRLYFDSTCRYRLYNAKAILRELDQKVWDERDACFILDSLQSSCSSVSTCDQKEDGETYLVDSESVEERLDLLLLLALRDFVRVCHLEECRRD